MLAATSKGDTAQRNVASADATGIDSSDAHATYQLPPKNAASAKNMRNAPVSTTSSIGAVDTARAHIFDA
jgi:hypothetical protein